MATWVQARDVKNAIIGRWKEHAVLFQVGTEPIDDGYGVHVRLREGADVDLANEIDGVPIRLHSRE